ncbi:MAG: ABC transporter substrate-binding protein [Planctomycetes bacterium]|nr:ABC transporter substrate-binding protein [Planctomycetota bacterium]
MLAASALFMGACAPAAAPAAPAGSAAATTAPKPAAPAKSVVGLGVVNSLINMQLFLADSLGYFKEVEQKLNVKVELQNFNSSVDTGKALAAGQVDFIQNSGFDVVQRQLESQDFRVLATWSQTGIMAVMVKPDSSYKQVTDLAGKTWGVSALGAGTHTQSISIARTYGLDPNSVNFIGVAAGANYIPALRDGKVDVIAAGEPSVSQMEQENIGRALVDLFDPATARKVFGSDIVGWGLVSRGEVIDTYPEITQAIVTAHYKAEKWLIDNKDKPDLVFDKLPDVFKSARPAASRFVPRLVGSLAPNALTTEAMIEAQIKNLKDTDQIPKDAKVNVKATFNNRFVEQAARDVK